MKHRIKKVFIANRGEVLRRIAWTAKKNGIETVAIRQRSHENIYLDGLIDEFVDVDIEDVSLYLDQGMLIDCAKKKGCDALHPGFGFLSENSSFAKNVEEQGLLWIGPSYKVIEMMGDKSRASKIAHSVGVMRPRCVDAFRVPANIEDIDLDVIFSKVGFPLIIKAALGGGGKGMRLVYSEETFLSELKRASSEAKSSFGDDLLMIESYIKESRHVEVQVLADYFGNVKILGDRDCSVQRRHQKIIEESPATVLSDSMRSKLHLAAKNIAQKVKYVSCGTVEFLVPYSKDTTGSKEQEFYFLEMNTRLQVEHTVTEERFSIDLVEWQFRIAQKEKIPEFFDEKKFHSIEARIYAEDPSENFMPSPGLLAGFKPFHASGVRWEFGADTICFISEHFDPMIAKVIVTAANRRAACRVMSLVLENSFVAGVRSNREFLMEIFRDSEFVDSPVSSSYLEKNCSRLLKGLSKKKEDISCELDLSSIRVKDFLQSDSDSCDLKSRIHSIYSRSTCSGKKISGARENYKILRDGKEISVYLGAVEKKGCKVDYSFWKDSFGIYLHLQSAGFEWRLKEGNKSWKTKGKKEKQNKKIVSSIPGKITSVFVEAGQVVSKNEICFILESMKMEFSIKTDHDSIIKKVYVKKDDKVEAGKLLAELL